MRATRVVFSYRIYPLICGFDPIQNLFKFFMKAGETMRKTLTLLVAMLVTAPLWAQTTRIITEDQREQLYPIERDIAPEILASPEATAPGDELPIGTITTDVVTAIKVGASSNAYSFILSEQTQISALSASDGDAISFIYRQNIADCGGQTIDNGLYRVSVSSDGGTSWNVGSAGTASATSTPIGCYGIGPINANYTRVSRYPNFLLSLPGAGATQADMIGVYTGAVLDPGYPTVEGWDGVVGGVVTGVTGASPVTAQEDYFFDNNDQFQSYQLTERVPGEYWYVAWDYNGPGAANEVGELLKINKGTYDATTQSVNWTNQKTVVMPFVRYLGAGATDSSTARTTPLIAFSPDGTTGYVSMVADVYDRDSVFLPVFLKSTDGGVSWGDPYEVKLREFPELIDLIQSFWIVVDTTTGDTLPAGNGVPTTGFDHDLTVDKNGNPHFVTIVANAGSNTADGGRTLPNYSISSALRMYVIDVTVDGFGDPNVLVMGSQATFRGSIGLIGAGGSDETTADPWMQASRTPDGSKVFVSWTETDTTGDFGNNDNSNPNFITRAVDVDQLKATDVTDWTLTDATWSSRAIMPKVAPVLLDDGAGNYTLPTVIMDVSPNTTLLNPVSYWYFSDVAYDDADFTNDISFFYNCKENPFSNTIQEVAPGCGASDGSLTVNASGGLGSYAYQWDAAAGSSTMATVSGLSAGIYEVTVTDSLGCTDVISVTLDDANSAALAVDSTSNITCFGDGNGYAEVTATPAMGSTVTSYLWSNGETTAIATMLPSGTNTLTVTDDQNCVSTITVMVTEPSDISLDASADDADCFGDASGSVSAVAFGGTGALSYLWDNGAMTSSVSGLASGSYSVTVTDENGCFKDVAVTVGEPDSLALALSANANTAAAAPFNGFASVTYTGGTDPVTFEWTGPDGFSGSSNIIFGLNGGMYVVTSTDANGCVTVDSVEVDGYVGPGDAIEDELAAGISTMSIFPNPNNGVFSVNLELDRAQDVTIEVLNLRGQVVSRVEERNAVILDHNFSLTNLTAGIYFVQVTTERGTAGRKVVLR